MIDVLTILGKFWEKVEGMPELAKSIEILQEQIDQERTELVNSTSRHKIDVFRKRLWYPLTVELDDGVEQYDSGDFFDSLGLYDQSSPTNTMTLPDYIHSADFASDGINSYTFRNPIVNRKFEVPDGVKTVWLRNAMIDCDDLYTQFGYALGIKLPSSERYKSLINALMDGLVNGPSYGAYMLGLSAITGLPVIVDKKETVISIEDNKVITDSHTYECSGDIVLEVGKTYLKGDPVTNDIEVDYEPDGIELGTGMTGVCYPITFLNQECATTVSTEDGYTRVDIDTLPKEVLDAIHSNGISEAIQVLDPCELHTVQKQLELPVITPTPNPPKPSDNKVSGALGSFVRFHRFN